MTPVLSRLLHPLNLAGVLTWLAVALLLHDGDTPAWRHDVLLGLWLAAFLGGSVADNRSSAWRIACYVVQAASALMLIWLPHSANIASVLLVVLVAQLAMTWPLRVVLPLAVAGNLAIAWMLATRGHPAPFALMLSYGGFQLFAALTAYYARSAEQARDRLAVVNADLLATRALLADGARDAERLRLARELHDVAGHKLTALLLNLRALGSDTTLAQRSALQTAQSLSQELLGDLRNVVRALREVEGLDLATALCALAAPLPRPVLALEIANDVRITDTGFAETLLRVVQEALTNSARHGHATTLRVSLRHEAGRLQLRIEDDGRLVQPLRIGHGLAGMRERVEDAGGTLQLDTAASGALRIAAHWPAGAAP